MAKIVRSTPRGDTGWHRPLGSVVRGRDLVKPVQGGPPVSCQRGRSLGMTALAAAQPEEAIRQDASLDEGVELVLADRGRSAPVLASGVRPLGGLGQPSAPRVGGGAPAARDGTHGHQTQRHQRVGLGLGDRS